MILIILILILGFPPMIAAQPWHICGTNNYTANGAYQDNVDFLSHSLLTIGSNPTGLFAKGSTGKSPNTVYAVALCRGDLNASSCSTCVDAAFKDATQQCGLSKDATIFYDSCTVRFSDVDILNMDYSSRVNTSAVVDGALELMNLNSEPMLPGWEMATGTFKIFFKKMLSDTVTQALLRPEPYAAIRVAVNDESITVQQLYCLAQCAPDLIKDICSNCLQNFSDLAAANFAWRQRGRVLGLRCNLRYDTEKFFAGEPTWSSPSSSALVPSPSPSPPQQPVPLPSPPQQPVSQPSPTQQPVPLPSSKPKKPQGGKVLAMALVTPLLALAVCIIVSFRFRRQIKGDMNTNEEEAVILGLDGGNSEFKIYELSQVLEATGNFSEENKLGQGGFGPVYKGQFPDGVEVAVKRLASQSGQGLTEFKNEIRLIAKLQHTNLVRLMGCCYQGQEKILIYEYLPNKSLDFFIFDVTRRVLLGWNKRLAIIDGIAQGLLYLHKHSRLRVIHRDLKASNILLDCEMIPKISDFGLAKIFSTNDSEGNTNRIAGTYGYMAPEYASEGLFSVKSDVFSFGVLMLEIVSGKRTSSIHRYGEFINLIGHAWQMWNDGTWLQLVDTSLLAIESHKLEMMRCINIALLCVQESAADRPTMSEIVAMLSNDTVTLPEPKHPAFFNLRVTNEEPSTIVVLPSANGMTVSAIDGR